MANEATFIKHGIRKFGFLLVILFKVWCNHISFF